MSMGNHSAEGGSQEELLQLRARCAELESRLAAAEAERERLAAETARLAAEAQRLRRRLGGAEGAMHSRLKDALRE
ncbi:hypothetical protein NYE40_19590 [Paenibacillus sp. FSL W8-1187]|uniref:Uncharacterized protein n=1 Tax=Paenibacillus pasadenensis TaxID=217090 RepID=A0A2N5NAZ8_9BACL|nr:hypothetical protein [Paenibacillus pasadenensis]PLT47484.1 hypothetical protein B8V81_1708 [Paenibacillus pasadenensis]